MSDQRIYATSVELENYRGFGERVAVDLHPCVTVFAGVNGSGKTSVLEAIAGLLSAVPSVLAGRKFTQRGLETTNIGRLSTSASTGILLTNGRRDARWFFCETLDRLPEYLRRKKVSFEFSFVVELSKNVNHAAATLPVLEFIHSSSTRMPSGSPETHVHERLVAYRGCFDSEALQFQQLEDWYEQEENLENEQRIRKHNLNLTIPSLRAVRGAVETFLSHLHQSRLANLKVVRFHAKGPLEPASGKLAMDKDGQQLMLTQLSDGERRLVLMVADIARRMAILNPALADPLQSPGIILVDEIELHLHPLWQRTVVPALQAAFPNVQLLLTTHSPQVLASVPDECVVILKDGQAMPGHPRVHGRDTNTILEQTMGASARPPEVQARIDEVYSLLDRRPEDARARLEALEAELGDDEPDLVRARAMMDFVGI